MEFDAARNEKDRPMLAIHPAKAPAGAEPVIVDPPEHNIVFTSLVTGDQDIVGLVAYSIYKQNKYDWLQAFSREQGRMPDEVEAQSYLLGESTPRRLATYRHLAEAMLEGRGPSAQGPASRTEARRPARSLPLRNPAILGLIAVVIVAVALFWLFHAGATKP